MILALMFNFGGWQNAFNPNVSTVTKLNTQING